MTIHDPLCSCDTYGCQLRRKGIRLSSNASPTARSRRPWRPKVEPSWEKGIAGERRPGGDFMPYVGEHSLTPIRVKEAAERRVEINEIRKQRHQQEPAS